MKRFSKRKEALDKTSYGYQGKPKGDDYIKDHISIKALRDLPKSSYALKADPYTAALPTSEPYPILNAFNKPVGGHYSGEDNIDGGNVQQYANSTTSNFLKAFDSLRTKINVNYRYLPILRQTVNVGTQSEPENIVIGKQLVDEMRKSLSETVSILKSTTFTQMAINNFAIETDLELGSATPKLLGTRMIDGVEEEVYGYNDLTDVLYAMSIYYQIFLQNGLSVMNWHNSFRLKQGTAIRNAWNREVPNLNSFFGLMNKKAFLSLLESINLSFEGEYIDKQFMEQMNLLTMMPSRRSNSINDPVLELQCGFNHPTIFRVYVTDNNGEIIGDPFFDDANMKLAVKIGSTSSVVSFWDACDSLRDYLSLEATQRWARINQTPSNITNTDTSRYNDIKSLFDVLIASFTYFKPTWADFREAFDVMSRTGTVSWTKGFRPSITKDTDNPLFWNLTVDHVYQMIMSGSDSVDYDEYTKRWRTFTLWNIYSGVPEYDIKQGGAFLTFSFKNLDGIETSEQIEYLPRLFNSIVVENDYGSVSCVALSRDGVEVAISVQPTKINTNIVLNRLAPLKSQSDLSIRVPVVSYDDNHTEGSTLNPTTGHYSNLYKTLCQVFGLCAVQSTENGSYDYALDPDLLAIYQIELCDITNAAITYSRANAPFRGTTSSEGLLGFAGLKG